MADDHQAAARSALQFPSLVPLAVVTLAALVLVGIAAARGEPAWLAVGAAVAAALGAFALGALWERRRRRQRAGPQPRG